MKYMLFDKDTADVQMPDFTMRLLKNYVDEYKELSVRRSLIADGDPLYVFMSHDTYEKLKQISPPIGYVEEMEIRESMGDKIFDCNIICKDDLTFGIVDVR